MFIGFVEFVGLKSDTRFYVLRSRCYVAKISHEAMNDTLRLHCLLVKVIKYFSRDIPLV